jgi:ASC-1-like (ASCH) protein
MSSLKIDKEKIKEGKKTNKLGPEVSFEESSNNIQAPETAPFDKRVTRRVIKLATQVTPEFKTLLKQLSVDHNCLMVEIIEKAVTEFADKYSKKK